MQTVQIIIGLLIILLVYLDFFHTTLSGNGFGVFSRIINQLLNRLIIRNRNRRIFSYSGLTHLIMTTCMWLSLLFLGVFIVYTAGEEMVVNLDTSLPATKTERFYFTGYVLSTLGIGDLVPGNNISKILTGILSFSGLILVTTGLTYLLSVINAVLSKKQLSFFIATMGNDIEEMYDFFKTQQDLENLVSDAATIKEQILKNSSIYLAFPIINYFLSKQRESALIVQLAMLYEVLMVLRLQWPKGTVQYIKINSLVLAIERYLELGLEESNAAEHDPEKLRTLRSYWQAYGHEFKNNLEIDRQFSSSLKYAGWSWEDVYKLKEAQNK